MVGGIMFAEGQILGAVILFKFSKIKNLVLLYCNILSENRYRNPINKIIKITYFK